MWDDPTYGLSIILGINKLKSHPNKKSIYLPIKLCHLTAFNSLKVVLRDSEGPNLVLGLGYMRVAHVVS